MCPGARGKEVAERDQGVITCTHHPLPHTHTADCEGGCGQGWATGTVPQAVRGRLHSGVLPLADSVSGGDQTLGACK